MVVSQGESQCFGILRENCLSASGILRENCSTQSPILRFNSGPSSLSPFNASGYSLSKSLIDNPCSEQLALSSMALVSLVESLM